jgi:diaminopimelate epimerase
MTIHFPINFDKMSGTGNDFIIIDHREMFIPLNEQADFAKKVCRRMFSVGADGLILLENSDVADFRWRFYNSDGSIAEMCGNGARCTARFAFRKGMAGKSMRFETVAGIIEAKILGEGEDVSILMTEPFGYRRNEALNLDGIERQVHFVNTGVPHAVIFLDNDEAPVKIWGRKVRFHELFQPDGVNANFVSVSGENQLKVRTYERGVEDETMACGTGCVASAIMAALEKGMTSPIKVQTWGGDELAIFFDLSEDGTSVQKVYMQGATRLIYSGQLTAESML